MLLCFNLAVTLFWICLRACVCVCVSTYTHLDAFDCINELTLAHFTMRQFWWYGWKWNSIIKARTIIENVLFEFQCRNEYKLMFEKWSYCFLITKTNADWTTSWDLQQFFFYIFFFVFFIPTNTYRKHTDLILIFLIYENGYFILDKIWMFVLLSLCINLNEFRQFHCFN